MYDLLSVKYLQFLPIVAMTVIYLWIHPKIARWRESLQPPTQRAQGLIIIGLLAFMWLVVAPYPRPLWFLLLVLGVLALDQFKVDIKRLFRRRQ